MPNSFRALLTTAKAYIHRDMRTYFTLMRHGDDYTLMSPFGGEPTRGSDTSPERLEALERYFRSGKVVEFPSIPYYFGGATEEGRRGFENEVRESGRSILRLTQEPLADAGISVNLELREGRPADVICAFVVEGEFDLVIVGSRGRGLVSRVLIGSVSHEVVQAATCPVLVVH